MAVCTWCDREMTATVSCTVAALHLDGVPHRLPPNGSRRCGDCAAPARGLHHPGCDLARCPRCGGQLFSCGCRFDEDESLDEDDLEPW